MTKVTYNNKEMTLHSVEKINGAIGADLEARGFVPAFFTLVGKRGGTVTCLQSSKTGEFVKF